MTTRRRLLIIAVALLALANLWLGYNYLVGLIPESKLAPLDNRPAVTRQEPLAVYASAVRVNLLIQDKYEVRRGEYSSNPSGIDLDKEQRKQFEAAIKKVVTVRQAGVGYSGGAEAACFVPHHFFRYYDKKGQKLGEIAICFCCTGGSATPDLTGGEGVFFDINAIERLVKKMNLPTDVNC